MTALSDMNFLGLATLIRKEIGRFLNVYTQTILAPAVTTLLFFSIFAIVFRGHDHEGMEIAYLDFLAPGLVMMAMVQNAFANTSSSILISKIQGNIVDVLMPPLSSFEILTGYMVGGIVRGLGVGVVCLLVVVPFVDLQVFSWTYIVLSAVLGVSMMSLLGVAGGLWSEKFDHMAAMTNFVITPLTFLSGTFYSVSQIPGFWRTLVEYNPFFHMIDGFRYGLTGHADGALVMGLWLLAAINAALFFGCYRLLRSGYRIKA